MTLPVSIRIARRELKGGLRDFRIFLASLMLGIAAIAAVGSVRASIEDGLHAEGAVLLGGDAELEFTYRFASGAERAWIQANALEISEIVDFRSMAVTGPADRAVRGLTQVKAVDDAYPIYGKLRLTPDMPVDQALAETGGLPGAILHPVLAAQLDIAPGDTFRLGLQEFRLTALLQAEPDSATMGFGLGPRSIVRTADLAKSGLIGPGSLYETQYRLRLAPDADLAALKRDANRQFRDNGLRWRDRRNGAPGVAVFVDRIASFLVLVGLAGLAVGGVGVAAAVQSYLDGKTGVIATLKSLGATSGLVFRVYLIQIGLLSLLGIVLGLALGAALPFALVPLLQGALPLPVSLSVYPEPLAEAALYGLLSALLFMLWPIARTADIRPAALFRDAVSRRRVWPGWPYLLAMLALFAALVGTVALFAAVPELALWTLGGILAALLMLVLAALAIRRLAARLAAMRVMRGRPALRLALASVGGPGSDALPVILSLGLGLSVLAAIGQIDSNLRGAISRELPAIAPAFFFVDIQNDQLDDFLSLTRTTATVTRVESAPMLRGIITRINDRPAREVAGDHWVVSGDRGITYSALAPDGTVLTQGAWWPEDYDGPPLVSFAEREAAELGLKLGDRITVNILGFDIEATIGSLRVVDFSTAGIGFVLAMNPAALAGAPHTHIATVYSGPEAEPVILREVGKAWPNITAIRVRDAINRVAGALQGIAAATSYAALATLLTGFVVLIGAAATGQRRREYEAAILKTLGAERWRILLSFALRALITGAAAGLVAILAGGLAGWAVMHFVMEEAFVFEPASALAIVLGGAAVTLIAGLAFALRPLAVRPARVLRGRE
ncbi:MAG: FtsX-like permease family protein [Rhodobacteraceae bacterium]|nr:FtsX-like permease family protein [Paracoccaceae bacterium]